MRVLLATTVPFLCLVLGCPPQPAEPPLAPPFLVDKNIFRPTRDWYVAATLIDAPFNSAVIAHLGQTSPAEKITWTIQEDFLIAHRAYSLYRGDDDDTSGLNDHTDPILAFPIRAHVDLFEGQLVRAPRESWAETAYMVVDWGNNTVPSFLEGKAKELTYAFSDPADPLAPIVGDDYVEVNSRFSIDERDIRDPWSSVGTQTACADGDFQNCEPGEFTVRRSMFPVDEPDEQQEVFELPNELWSMFPHFRKSFLFIDSRFGETEYGKRFFVDRYNVWQKTRDDDGALIPPHERSIKPIVWYLGDDTPDYVTGPMQGAIASWDEALRTAVNGRRYWSCLDSGGDEAGCSAFLEEENTVIKLCPHNPVEAGDDEDCGPAGTHARLGDLRFNSLWWLRQPVQRSVAAVGWFNVDHETARIFSSQVYLAADDLWNWTYQAAVAVQLMNGDLDLDSFEEGDPVEALLEPLFDDDPYGPGAAFEGSIQTLSNSDGSVGGGGVIGPGVGRDDVVDVAELRARLAKMDLSFTRLANLPPLDKRNADAFRRSVEARVAVAVDAGAFGPGSAQLMAREQSLHDTEFEDGLIDDERVLAAGIEDPSALTAEELREAASPLRHHDAPVEGIYALAEPIRDAVVDAPYAEFAVDMKGRSLDEVAQAFLDLAMENLLQHELGHTLGLRHNFAGSYDAMNYQPGYWAARDDGDMGPRWRDPITEDEVAKGIYGQAYSSVMDYMAFPGERAGGLGHWDKAAVKLGYGGMLEVFNNPLAAEHADLLRQMQGWNDTFTAVATYLDGDEIRGIHYTEYPSLVGDLEDRSDVPLSHFIRNVGDPMVLPDGRPAVPYRACSDEERVFATCEADDRGADTFEKAVDLRQRYHSYYFNTHFRWGRLLLKPPNSQFYLQYFKTLTLAQLFTAVGVDDLDKLATDEGLASTTLGLGEGFDLVADMLATPEPGAYQLATREDGTDAWAWTGYVEGEDAVPLGVGRFVKTVVDNELTGRHYLERVEWWGSAADKDAAIDALTLPFVLREDPRTVTDPRALNISLALIFPEQTVDLMGAVLAEDWQTTGPYYDPVDGVVPRRWIASQTPPVSEPMTPAIHFRTRNYLRTVGPTRLGAGVTTRFHDLMRIVVVGASDDFTTTLPTVSFTDPGSGRTFRAMSRIVDGRETGIGARMLLHAEDLRLAIGANEDTAFAVGLGAYVQEIDHLRRLTLHLDGD